MDATTSLMVRSMCPPEGVSTATACTPLWTTGSVPALPPVVRQQLLEKLGDPLVGELMDLGLVPGDDFARRIPRCVGSVLALQQNQRRLSKRRRDVRDAGVRSEDHIRRPDERE